MSTVTYAGSAQLKHEASNIIAMKYIMLALLILASTASLAEKPDVLPGNNGSNGDHYAYGKQRNNGNQSGASQKVVSIPEASTLALIGLGFAGLMLARRRKK